MSSIRIVEPRAIRGERLSFSGVLMLASLCLIVSFGALASLPRARDGAAPVAIVFPPWTSGSDAVASSFAAGHRVLRSGRLHSIVVVVPGHSVEGAPSLPQGAWFSLILAGLAGCLDPGAETEISR